MDGRITIFLICVAVLILWYFASNDEAVQMLLALYFIGYLINFFFIGYRTQNTILRDIFVITFVVTGLTLFCLSSGSISSGGSVSGSSYNPRSNTRTYTNANGNITGYSMKYPDGTIRYSDKIGRTRGFRR